MTGFSSAPRHERVFDGRAASAWRAVPQRLLHVLAGAERAAGTGEDGDLELVAVAELGPGLGKLRAHLVVECVEPLGPVHAHHEYLPVALGFDDGHVVVSYQPSLTTPSAASAAMRSEE